VYLFGKNAGMDVIIGDEEYVIMREREILGLIGIIEKAKRARKYLKGDEGAWLRKLF
jgi:hypothetical protein